MAARGRGRSLPGRLGRLVLGLLCVVAAGILQTLILVASLAAALVALLSTDFGLELARRVALDQTREMLPGLSIRSLSGGITRELVLEGVVLEDRFGGEAVRLERLLLRYDLAALMDRSIRVLRLEVDRPQVLVKPAQNGELNLTQLVVLFSDEEDKPPSEPLSWTVDLDALKISRGAARVDAGGRRYEVENLGLAASANLALQSNKLSLTLSRLGGRAAVPGQPLLDLLVSGEVGWDGSERLSARTRVKLATVKRDATNASPKTKDSKPLLPVAIAPNQKLSLDLQVSGPLSRLGLKLAARLPKQGTVDLDGWVGLDLAGSAPLGRYEAKLKLSRVNPKPLVPKLFSTDINLGLTVNGSGIPLQPGSEATVALDVGPSSVMEYRLDRLGARAGLKEQTWTLDDLKLEASGATLLVSGKGTLKKILHSKIKLDVPGLARLPLPPSVPRLSGAVDADLSVTGPFLKDLSVTGEVNGKALAVNALRVGSARVVMDLRGLPREPDGELRVSAARVLSVKGKKRSLLLSSGAVSVSGNRKRLTLKAGVRRPDLRADLTLGASLSPELPPKKITARLRRLDLRHQKLSARLLNRPRVSLRMGQYVKLEPLRIRTLGGELRAGATYRFTAQPRLEARVEAIEIRPVKGPPMSGKLTARVGRRALTAKLLADLSGSKLTLDARVPLRYQKGVPSPSRRAPLDLRLRAPSISLALVKRFLPKTPALGGTASLEVTGSGSLRAPRVDLELGLDEISSPYMGPLSGTGRVVMGKKESTVKLSLAHRWRAKDSEAAIKRPLVTVTAGAPLTMASLIRSARDPLRALSRLPARGRLTVHATPLPALGNVYPLLKEASGTVAADLELSGSLRVPDATAHLRIKDGRVAGQKLGTVAAEMKLWGDGGPRTNSKLTLRLGKLKLAEVTTRARSALVDLLRKKSFATLPVEMEAVFPQVKLSALKDYHRLLQMTKGTFDGEVTMKGTIKAPRATARLNLQDTRLNRQVLGDVTSRVSFDGRLFGLKLVLKQGRRGRAKVGISFDLKKREGMSASLLTRHLDIGFVKELVPALRELEGKLHGSINASGGLERPKIKGQLRLQGARVRVSGAPTLEKVDAHLGLSQDRVRLVSLSARRGRGLITATGKVDLKDLRPTTFRLDARSTLFDLGVGPLKKSAFFGNLSVDGKLADNALSADVRLSNGSLKMAGLGGDRKLHSTKPLADVVFEQKEDPRKAAVAKKTLKPAKPLKLNVKVVVEPLRVQIGDDFDLEAETDVRATTGPKGKLRLHGWAGLRKGGILDLMGARYTVERAKVRFTGKPEPDPTLDVVLSRHIQTVLVLIGVGGSAKAHKLSFKSDPPNYTEAQVINMIATGRVEEAADDMDGDTGGEQKTGQRMTMANALANAFIGTFAGKAVSKVGLDVARVNVKEQEDEEQEVKLQAQAEVGKYLTKDLYVGYRRIFGATDKENDNEGILEYTFMHRWLLSLYYGNEGVGGVDVFWTFRY